MPLFKLSEQEEFNATCPNSRRAIMLNLDKTPKHFLKPRRVTEFSPAGGSFTQSSKSAEPHNDYKGGSFKASYRLSAKWVILMLLFGLVSYCLPKLFWTSTVPIKEYHEASLSVEAETKIQQLLFSVNEQKEELNGLKLALLDENARRKKEQAQDNQHNQHEIKSDIDMQKERIAYLESSVRNLIQTTTHTVYQKKTQEEKNEFANADDVRLIDSLLNIHQTTVDWAQSSIGGKIVKQLTTVGIGHDSWREIILDVLPKFMLIDRYRGLVKPKTLNPDIMIAETKLLLSPGECFAFEGQQGNVTIQLPRALYHMEISIEHITTKMNPHRDSTPRIFQVFTLPERLSEEANQAEYEFFRNLQPFVYQGQFEYEGLQRVSSFILESDGMYANIPSRRVTFSFLENFGAPWTCIYRLKVHGTESLKGVIF